MAKPASYYVDGYVSPSRETTVVPDISYPFSSSPTPDVRTQVVRRSYDVYPFTYTPRLALRTTVSNLLPYSESPTAANGYTLTNLTQSLNAANPLTGASASAYTFLETVTNAGHELTIAATATADQYTLSAFVKPSGRQFLRLRYTDSGATSYSGVFDITNGAVFSQTNATASFIRTFDGYLRLFITFTPAAGAGTVLYSFSTNGSTFSYAGDVTKGAVIWGLQMTLGGTTVSYLSNTTTVTSRSAPDGDSQNPFAWLVVESDPVNQTSDLARIVRSFAMVPQTQVVPSSLMLTKPTLPLQQTDQVVGSYYVNRPNSAKESYDAYFMQTVQGDTGAPSFYPTGGTYTLTFGGNTTTNIAYNASAATVKSALDALTSVTTYGGLLSSSGTYNSSGGLSFIWNAISQATLNSSLTSAGPTAAVMSYPGSTTGAQGQLQVIGGYNTTNAPITGGTFTITVLGQTTAAIAYNASVSAVQAAINLLSNVSARGGVTVTFPYSSGTTMAEPSGPGFGLSFSFSYPALTSSAASLTPAPCTIDTSAGGGGTLVVRFAAVGASTRSLYIPAHGITASDTLFILGDGAYYAGITSFTVPNNDFIQLSVSPSASYAAVVAITKAGKRTKSDYRPGTTGIRCLKTTAFYLPGVTYGISSFSDIPIPTNQSDSDTFLQAVFAGTGNLNWQVGEAMPWMGAILQQTTTSLAVSDI